PPPAPPPAASAPPRYLIRIFQTDIILIVWRSVVCSSDPAGFVAEYSIQLSRSEERRVGK
ncbi:hypothetical protein MMA25_24040, partial [Salmonella enterica]|nr:hypothetical protein [Salmonella enterica]